MFKSWKWKQRSYRNQFQGDEGNAGSGGSGAAEEQKDAGAEDEESTDDADQDSQDTEGGEQAEGEPEEVVITLGDQEIAPPADEHEDLSPKARAAWVRMRQNERELKQKVRDLEAAATTGQQAQAAPAAEVLGAEPQPEDFDFDPHEYAKAFVKYEKQKDAIAAKAATAQKEQETVTAAWNKRFDGYKAGKAKLNVPDFDEAEDVVRQTLNQTQIGMIIDGADKAELLVYALGRNPAKLKELAAIKNPVQFIFAAAKIETQLKVEPRKAPPPAERVIRSSGGATSIDNNLARLEAEADRTGNRSKVAAYRREQRLKQSA